MMCRQYSIKMEECISSVNIYLTREFGHSLLSGLLSFGFHLEVDDFIPVFYHASKCLELDKYNFSISTIYVCHKY